MPTSQTPHLVDPNAVDPIRFDAPLERTTGPATQIHILRFPGSAEETFGTRGYVRVVATLNGVAMQRSLLPAGDGTHYLIINQEQRRMAGIEEGDMVTVLLERDGEPGEPDLPEELVVVLDLDEAAHARYERQTPATRRSIVAWISQAKRPETREKRALDLLGRLQSKDFIFGGSKGKE